MADLMEQFESADSGDSQLGGSGFGPVDDADDGEVSEVSESDAEEVAESDDAVADEPDGSEESTDPRAKLAADHGLDVNNPAHKKLIDMLMAQEKSPAEEPQSGGKETEEMFAELDGLFAESEKQQGEPAKPAAAPPAAASAPGDDNPFGDGFRWQSAEDAYADENSAWGLVQAAMEAAQSGTLDPKTAAARVSHAYQEVNRVQMAFFNRRLAGAMPMIARQMQQMMKAHLQETLGPVLPQINEVVESRRSDSARHEVQSAIAKSKAGDMFRKMMTPAAEGFVEVDGERLPDTPFNRIVKDVPGILNIEIRDANGRVDARKTMHAQYVSALRIYAKQKQQPTEARKLVEAGKKIQAAKQSEKARQAINSSGASRTSGAARSGGGPRPMSVEEFFRAS